MAIKMSEVRSQPIANHNCVPEDVKVDWDAELVLVQHPPVRGMLRNEIAIFVVFHEDATEENWGVYPLEQTQWPYERQFIYLWNGTVIFAGTKSDTYFFLSIFIFEHVHTYNIKHLQLNI